MGVLDTLDAATPSQESVTMCIDGKLQAEWDRVRERVETAGLEDADKGSLAMPELTKVANELDEIRQKMLDRQVTFLFQRMEWAERITLQAEHPPRPDNIGDQLRGFNAQTFYPELVKRSCLSVTDSTGDVAAGRAAGDREVLRADGDPAPRIPDETWTRLLGHPATDTEPAVTGSLNLRQVDRLVAAANSVNDGETSVPPSARSLLVSQDSGASLAQPSPGTPPPSGSTGGSRPGSRKSSTRKKASTRAGSAAS
jgi:hypothetical protein